VAALVPPPLAHRTRFHGVFAPNAKLRAQLAPFGAGQTSYYGRGVDCGQHIAPHEGLERLNPLVMQIVELRYFGGLKVSEVASLLKLDERPTDRDWAIVRARLKHRLELENLKLTRPIFHSLKIVHA